MSEDKDFAHRVTLEKLLRIKRCEKPSPEFWEKFNAQLEQKRLNALVRKRSSVGFSSLVMSIRFVFGVPLSGFAIWITLFVIGKHSIDNNPSVFRQQVLVQQGIDISQPDEGSESIVSFSEKGLLRRSFVTDPIALNRENLFQAKDIDENKSFRKVLDTKTFQSNANKNVCYVSGSPLHTIAMHSGVQSAISSF